LWRGSDVILQRPVPVVLALPPGGDSRRRDALAPRSTASRIVHPHLIGVYDAIDEGDRAYVVREWVEGTSLRRVVAEYGSLAADKARRRSRMPIAAAIAALHDYRHGARQRAAGHGT
jgi:serine/threonine protein kinase